MGPGETIAAVAGVGLAIGVLIFVSTIFQRIIAFKERQMGLTADATAEKAAQYASHVEQLEARVRVLERIATDKGADLAQQIEDLRAAPAPRLARAEEEVN